MHVFSAKWQICIYCGTYTLEKYAPLDKWNENVLYSSVKVGQLPMKNWKWITIEKLKKNVTWLEATYLKVVLTRVNVFIKFLNTNDLKRKLSQINFVARFALQLNKITSAFGSCFFGSFKHYLKDYMVIYFYQVTIGGNFSRIQKSILQLLLIFQFIQRGWKLLSKVHPNDTAEHG